MIHLLDIEGTICPITFVKDVLYPYFLENYAAELGPVKFPVDRDHDDLSAILAGFPPSATASPAALHAHIEGLVASDTKDPVLKSLQGKIWRLGYALGRLTAPLYGDAIDFLARSATTYIYSSGSVDAQKLLFAHVDVDGALTDLTLHIRGYYDIPSAGYKQEALSYRAIALLIGCTCADIAFYSDNIHEVRAAREAGCTAIVVVRPGNAPLTEEEKEGFACITTFAGVDA